MQSSKLLVDVLKRDGNNFDILRLVAALAVIVGHAYAIAPEPPLQDGVLSLLHFDYSGSLAVKFFFFLSGVLVTNSIIARPNPFQFLAKRAFRIFPGLLGCLLVSVFIIGPLFTKLSLGEYFSAIDTWRYLVKNFILTNMVWRLPGVFTESAYGLNGSLWTLPYEVLCYIYLAVFFGLGFLKNRIVSNIFFIAVIVASIIAPHYLPVFFAQNPEAHLLPATFALGALFANNKEFIRINISQTILLWLLVFLLNNTPAYQFLFYLAFFYTSIYIASLPFVIRHLKLPFDASYGVYVYGFMIQQCIHAVFPSIGVHGNQFASAIIAIGMGILSWYFIEKRFIDLGHRLTNSASMPGAQKRITGILRGRLLPLKNILAENKFFIFFFLSVLAFIIHAFVLKFIFPGYYSPLYPQHSDFYIPAAFANSTDTYASLLGWPRPVNMIFSKFIGNFGVHGSIAWVIALVCMNCALTALMIIRILKLSLNWKLLVAFAVYCYLLFSQPYFYIFYAQDIGAQLSFFFLIAGANLFYSTFNKPFILPVSILFVFSLLAFLSKETYGLAAAAFTFLWFVYYRKFSLYKALTPFLTIVVSLGIAIFINIFIKSIFVNLDAAKDSPYHINLNPIVLIREWLLYARDSMNLIHLVVLLLLGYVVYRYKNGYRNILFYLFIGCIAAAVLSWLPNAVLPNHHYKGYSFSGAYLLYLPLIFLPLIWISQYVNRKILIAIIALCVISPVLNKRKYKDNEWVLIQENTQRNLLKELKPLIRNLRPTQTPHKILVQGITFPFHPFSFPQSLRVFPNAKYATFDVINYNPGFANNVQNDLVKFIAPADSALINYEQKWMFDNDGKLVRSQNLLAEKIFTTKTDSTGTIQIGQENFSQFTSVGFYNQEGGIRWTNGNASINVNIPVANKDSFFVEMNTYMPPICKDVNPRLLMVDNTNKTYEPVVVTRKENVFYYLFVLNKGTTSIQRINIQSEKINALPDQRDLSFPFMSLSIKQ